MRYVRAQQGFQIFFFHEKEQRERERERAEEGCNEMNLMKTALSGTIINHKLKNKIHRGSHYFSYSRMVIFFLFLKEIRRREIINNEILDVDYRTCVYTCDVEKRWPPLCVFRSIEKYRRGTDLDPLEGDGGGERTKVNLVGTMCSSV